MEKGVVLFVQELMVSRKLDLLNNSIIISKNTSHFREVFLKIKFLLSFDTHIFFPFVPPPHSKGEFKLIPTFCFLLFYF